MMPFRNGKRGGKRCKRLTISSGRDYGMPPGKDSLHLTQIRDSLRMQEQETNFLFLKEQGNNTLGTFMQKMVRGSLTEEQQKLLDESLQKEIH